MTVRRRNVMVFGVGCLALAGMLGCGGGGGGGGGGGTEPPPPAQLQLELYDVPGFFSIQKPKGWNVKIAGHCAYLGILIQDPEEPRNQIFYFGEIGPVYMSAAKKQLDEQIEAQWPGSIAWHDAPVIDPLTADNFFVNWPQIAAMETAKKFMAEFPTLADLEIIASAPQTPVIPGGSCAQARIIFGADDAVGEGMVLGTVNEVLSDLAYGFSICGITATKDDFETYVDQLVESLESFTVTEPYVSNCMIEQQQVWGAVAKAGQTLRETSDMIYEGWVARSQSEDILFERSSDVRRSVERLYDTSTGQVYEFDAGWYDQYQLDPNQYSNPNLEPLPLDDYGLWSAAPADGASNVHFTG